MVGSVVRAGEWLLFEPHGPIVLVPADLASDTGSTVHGRVYPGWHGWDSVQYPDMDQYLAPQGTNNRVQTTL